MEYVFEKTCNHKELRCERNRQNWILKNTSVR